MSRRMFQHSNQLIKTRPAVPKTPVGAQLACARVGVADNQKHPLSAPLILFIILIALVFTTFTLTGCANRAQTDAAGGISEDNNAAETTKNEISLSQLPDSSFIYDASITDLASADPYMNGQTVQVTGEVVGDRIRSDIGDGCSWITLQSMDGSYSEVAVFIHTSLTKPIDTYGAYGKRGTTLQVRGTFNLACADHEGITDLHADDATVVAKGATSVAEFSIDKFTPGFALVGVGLLLILFYRWLSRRRI